MLLEVIRIPFVFNFLQAILLKYLHLRSALSRMRFLVISAHENIFKCSACAHVRDGVKSYQTRKYIFNPTSPWASALLLIPKPGPVKFWFTVGLRLVNRFTIKHQSPMPITEQKLFKTSKSKVYATLNVSHSYYMLSLEKKSQSSKSFITLNQSFSPTRILSGSTTAVLYLKATIDTKLPHDLNKVLIQWLVDIFCRTPTIGLTFRPTGQFFDVCFKFSF